MTDDQLAILLAFLEACAQGEDIDAPNVAEVYIPRARRFIARHSAKLTSEKSTTPDPLAAELAAVEGGAK